MTTTTSLKWCAFRSIPSLAKAAEVSANCLFSLDTLEASYSPTTTSFALTECEHSEMWRWAIVCPAGLILDEGREPTQVLAKLHAEEALQLVAA